MSLLLILEAANNCDNVITADGQLAAIVGIIGAIVTIVVTIINVRAVNKNTTRDINNQNKQDHKPHLNLLKIEEEEVIYPIHFVNSSNYENDRKKIFDEYMKITLENKGYGIASNIAFYNLLTGEECPATYAESASLDQRYETNEIYKDDKKTFNFCFKFNNEKIDKSKNKSDFVYLLCDYQDLNSNHYQSIIGVVVKEVYVCTKESNGVLVSANCHFNEIYYQENTFLFRKTIECYSKEYNKIQKIIEQYDNLKNNKIKNKNTNKKSK